MDSEPEGRRKIGRTKNRFTDVILTRFQKFMKQKLVDVD